jgi:hypothetical protein
MYHINMGSPLLDAGDELVAPIESIRWEMRDARTEGIGYRFQQSPRYGCIEQVYVHDAIADHDGTVRAALINRNLAVDGGLGVSIEFQQSEFPYLIQWQNFQVGSYCMAVEPGTAHALGQAHAEAHGDLIWRRVRE